MRKSLLTIIAAAAAISAAAADAPPFKAEVFGMYDDMPLMHISANGEWGVGTYADTYLTIYNFKTGETWAKNAAEDNYEFYAPGTARSVSNNGIVLVSLTNSTKEPFHYWQNNEIHELPSTRLAQGGWCNGISSNGKYIVGLAYPNLQQNPGAPSSLPIFWEWDEKRGEWGKPVILPYPEVDMWGRKTRGSYACDVNDDGTVVSVLTTDSFGGFSTELGVARRSSSTSDDWTFEWVGRDVTVIPGLEPPVLPDVPYPYPADYMTPEEYDAWFQAEADWKAAGSIPEDYPNKTDFMTPEEVEKYTDAVLTYNSAMEQYTKEGQAFMDVYMAAVNEGKIGEFELNGQRMSANGKWLVATSVTDRQSVVGENSIFLFNLEDGTHTRIKPDKLHGIYALCVTDEGYVTFLDFYYYELVQNTWIYNPTDGSTQPIQDWVKARNPEAYAWMEGEMVHTFEGYKPTLIEDKYGSEWTFPIEWYNDEWVTGSLIFTPSMNILAGYALNYWNDGSDGSIAPVCYNYVINLSPEAGIQGPAVAPSEADAPARFFDLQGRPLERPLPGSLCIKLQGGKASKTLAR